MSRIEFDLVWPRLLLPEALPNQVVGDRDQPVRGLPRPLASLERAQGVDEGRLHDVLGVRRVAEHGVGVAIDLGGVGAVELVQLARSADPVAVVATIGKMPQGHSLTRSHKLLTSGRASSALGAHLSGGRDDEWGR